MIGKSVETDLSAQESFDGSQLCSGQDAWDDTFGDDSRWDIVCGDMFLLDTLA